MRRKRTDESQTEQGQQIGHITTTVENKDLERVKVILTRHAVHLEKIRTPDNWWTLFLPDGTRQIKEETKEKVTFYTIRLPDGYSFLYRAPVFNFNKSYDILPMITVWGEEELENGE